MGSAGRAAALPIAGLPLLFAAAPAATAASPMAWPENRVTNPGAEAGAAPTGWTTTTFSTALYGSSSQVPPAGFGAKRDFNADYGSRTFVATSSGGTMLQEASLADLAGPIDAGERALRFGGSLGGAAGTTDGATVTVQFLDAGDAPIGDPHTVGPPTATERKGLTTQLECSAYALPPVGARGARLTVAATGATATADAIFLSSSNFGAPGTAMPPIPAQGPGCVLDRPATGQPNSHTPAESSDKAPLISTVTLRRNRISFVASAAGRAKVIIDRRTVAKRGKRVRWVRQRTVSVKIDKPGTARKRFKRLRRGAYRVRLRATSPAGKPGRLVTVRRKLGPRR